MTIIDFLIGFFLANAMPHFIFGITKTKFLGLFGYTPKGNIIYALIQFIACTLLYGYKYNYSDLLNNGFLIGGISVMVLYFIFGKLLVKVYGKEC